MSDLPSTSKTIRSDDPVVNERILQFLRDIEQRESDDEVDDSDKDPNYSPSEESSQSHNEESSPENEDEDLLGNNEEFLVIDNYVEGENEFFWGKDGTVWLKKEPSTQRRTPHTNIIRGPLPGLTVRSRNLGETPSKSQVWENLFDQEILNEIVLHTNKKLDSVRFSLGDATSKINYKNCDFIEIKALIGLLMLKSIFRCSNEKVLSIFSKGITGRPIFRATLSMKRFEVLLACLRFDDSNTREERKKTDRAAAISFIFNKFIKNCNELYSPGTNVTIDEMLVPFRGKCGFRTYMPKKPKKYGVKIMCLTDSSTSYLVDAYIYKGKNTDGEGLTEDEQKFSKPTQSVIRLCKSIEGTNRNVTGDNWFTSVELVDELGDRSLTYVGTLKKNKKEIPIEFLPSKERNVGSAIYGFGGTITLLSVVPKKNRAVLLLSSMHHNIATDENNKKQEIVSYYNKTKAGVDLLDMKCAIYTSSSRTRRWPLAIFFQMIDISTVNSFIIYSTFNKNPLTTRFDFVHDLAMELLKPQLERRFLVPNLPRDLRKVLTEHLKKPQDENPDLDDKLPKRKTCVKCPSAKRRKTAYKCVVCSDPICLECSKKICLSCAKNH